MKRDVWSVVAIWLAGLQGVIIVTLIVLYILTQATCCSPVRYIFRELADTVISRWRLLQSRRSLELACRTGMFRTVHHALMSRDSYDWHSLMQTAYKSKQYSVFFDIEEHNKSASLSALMKKACEHGYINFVEEYFTRKQKRNDVEHQMQERLLDRDTCIDWHEMCIEACKNGNYNIVNMIDARTNKNFKTDKFLNRKDENGGTPFHKACTTNSVKDLKGLLDNGADWHIENNKVEISFLLLTDGKALKFLQNDMRTQEWYMWQWNLLLKIK